MHATAEIPTFHLPASQFFSDYAPRAISYKGWTWQRSLMTNSTVEYVYGGGAARVVLYYSEADSRLVAARVGGAS